MSRVYENSFLTILPSEGYDSFQKHFMWVSYLVNYNEILLAVNPGGLGRKIRVSTAFPTCAKYLIVSSKFQQVFQRATPKRIGNSV